MDQTIREKLQEQLSDYILDTLKYTATAKEFCDRESKWTLQRETELDKMIDIKDRADQITLKFEHVQKAENKPKAFGEYMLSSLTQFKADSKRQVLEKELGEVLKNTLEGLEKLQHFLVAVEKLAVTSLFVFMGESFMPKGVSSMSVRSVISAARRVSPLLVYFKRDDGAYFLPSLSNVEVLAFQLEKYIRVTQQICKKMESFLSRIISGPEGVPEWINGKSSVKLDFIMSEEQKLCDHLLQLTKIRTDESFRLTFLFGVKAQDFIKLFSERHSRMLQFLSDLDEAAVQLNKMKLGSNISTVAGSSVGIAGGVLSIVGLALAPVTAGVSLALTLTGVGLGVTSGANSIVTGITEMAVNKHHGKNANSIFIRFMEDVQKIQDCVEEVASSESLIANDVLTKVKVAVKVAASAVSVGKGIDALVDGVSAVKALRSEEIIAKAANVGLQEAKAARNIPQLAADLPDIGQLAKGTPLALSKSARAGFIGLNAFFIGLDVLVICASGISLSKGSKNEVAQLIHSRSVLWRSEVEAWKKIHDHLCNATSCFNNNQEILEQPFTFME
ncbi:apolipoprotein L5-like isoform X2 [Tachysurus fulvidraco]|uniref:apolipoprotein L5-like isoform X2 n=1 Tax=Tachysurus fulvidraco TaxID=1234273 RepID=UPI001FF03AED|nr:apolipoprotein L5-like isoform X2 [Tachysurus fulvidraco]